MAEPRQYETLQSQSNKKFTFKRVLLLCFFLIAGTVGLILFTIYGPSTPIYNSYETTRILSPLDADGNVDYVAALREHCKKGVTPENNAVVLLWQAWGYAGDISNEFDYEKRYFQELGMPVPPQKESAFPFSNGYDESFWKQGAEWIRDIAEKNGTTPKVQAKNLEEEYESYFDVITEYAEIRPWKSEQIPLLAKHLAANEKVLEILMKASKRPKYYAPLIRYEPKSTYVDTIFNDHTLDRFRKVSTAFSYRSMLRLADGQIDEAWQDAQAIHRFARLVNQNPNVMEQLVAANLHELGALRSDIAILDSKLSLQQAKRFRKDLAALTPACDMTTAIDIGARYEYLDTVACYSRKTFPVHFYEVMGSEEMAQMRGKVNSVDWNVPMVMGNDLFDDLVTTANTKDTSKQEHLWEQCRKKMISPRSQLTTDIWHKTQAFFLRGTRSEQQGQYFLYVIGDCSLLPIVSDNRARCYLALVRVASELAVYRAEHGVYPKSLSGLGKDISKKLPKDIYSGEPLVYKQKDNGKGYLLYSVGPNLIDEGGTSELDKTIKGEYVKEKETYELGNTSDEDDDLVIRLPLPKLDVKKFLSEMSE